jgi:hypothetical protein
VFVWALFGSRIFAEGSKFMRGQQLKRAIFHRIGTPATVAAAMLIAASLVPSAQAQQSGQQTFSSPEEASHALFMAIQGNDESALLKIFGPDGKEIVSSGDDAEDRETRANFAAKYQQMHRLVKEPDGSTTLYIGAENWPTPVPIANKGNAWYFDTEAGKNEILFRRVGRNEMSAIRICHELVAAQKEYYQAQHNVYCPKIRSDEGQRDGLYWKSAEGEPESPIGPLLAMAVPPAEGTTSDIPLTPFRGYYFRILTKQGKSGPGGAKDYMVDGKLTGGFAFIAFPAEYRSSGVMTFIVNQDGVVYQKDLGKNSDSVCRSMKAYNPGSGWKKVDDQEPETASQQNSR